MRPTRNTIAWRLGLWFLLLSVLPVAVMVVFVRQTVNDAFARLASREVRAEASLLAEALSGAPKEREAELLAAASDEARTVLILEPDGRLRSGRAGGGGAVGALPELPSDVQSGVRAGRAGEIVDKDTGRVFGWAPEPTGGGTVLIVRGSEVIDAPLLRMERASIAQLAVAILIVAVAGSAAIWMVIGPIQRLTAAAEAIGRGDLSVTIDGQDMEGELGVLTRAFNDMAERLRASYTLLEQQVADRTRELAALNRIAGAVGRSSHAEAMQEAALSTVLEQLDYDAGAICTLDRDTARLRLGRCQGFPGDLCAMAPWEAPARRAAASADPIVLDGGQAGGDLPAEAAAAFGVVALVPMSARGQVEGVLVLAHRAGRALPSIERELLVSIGHQIGIGLQNTRLQERAMQVAVLEERQRLSRELHDSVTQSLYGVTLYGEAASRLLAAGDTEQGTDYVSQACRTAQAALQEMRLLIFELRPSVLEEVGLVGALEARLEQVEGRAGIRTELDMDRDLRLAPEMEEALYRIAQEALNNALKHASARNVRVALRLDEGSGAIVLEVADDGSGMDVARARQHGGMGLRTMTERVEKLAGTLHIGSTPGEGTVVRVELHRGGGPSEAGASGRG